MKEKHAFLVLAHANQKQIELICSIIDNVKTDIFLHIDSKFIDFDICKIRSHVKHSELYEIKRRDVRWGDYSLVKLEVDSFKVALEHGPYTYYHLISAMDLPLKPIDEFLEFCEKNKGYNFVNVEPYCPKEDTSLYHFFPRHQKPNRKVFYYISRAFSKTSLKFQRIIGINRFPNIHFYKGSNWLSLTDDAARFVVESEMQFPRLYKYATCSDEKFIQTLMCNDEHFRTTLFPQKNGNLRLVDWKRGFPYVFKLNDYDELITSEMFWARKFDINVDGLIVDKIVNHISR